MFSSILNFQFVYFLSWQFSQLEKCLFLSSRKAATTKRVPSEAEIQEGFQGSSFADVSTHLSAFIRLNACITIAFVC